MSAVIAIHLLLLLLLLYPELRVLLLLLNVVSHLLRNARRWCSRQGRNRRHRITVAARAISIALLFTFLILHHLLVLGKQNFDFASFLQMLHFRLLINIFLRCLTHLRVVFLVERGNMDRLKLGKAADTRTRTR